MSIDLQFPSQSQIKEYKELIKFLYDSYDTAWFMHDIQDMKELEHINLIYELLDFGVIPLFYSTEWKNNSAYNQITHQVFYYSTEVKHSHNRFARDYALSGIKFNIYVEEKILQIIGLDLASYILQYKRQRKIDTIIE